LAIDYGTKFTGIAQFKPGSDPFPICGERIAYKNDQQLIDDIYQLVEDEFINLVVIGLPYLLDGKATSMTEKIKDFSKILRDKLGKVPVYCQDETLSSFEAEERMKNSAAYNFKVDMKKIDSVAATIILEDFIKDERELDL